MLLLNLVRNELLVMTETCVPVRLLDPDRAAAVGERLRAHRRALGLRLRHLASDRLPHSRLRSIERGDPSLDPTTLTEVASTYGVDLALAAPPRDMLTIDGDTMRIGPHAAAADLHSLTQTISSYLMVLSQVAMAGDDTAPILRSDVVRMAEALDQPCVTVISRMGDQLGGHGARTRAMVSLYLEGSSVVGFV